MDARTVLKLELDLLRERYAELMARFTHINLHSPERYEWRELAVKAMRLHEERARLDAEELREIASTTGTPGKPANRTSDPSD